MKTRRIRPCMLCKAHVRKSVPTLGGRILCESHLAGAREAMVTELQVAAFRARLEARKAVPVVDPVAEAVA